MNFVDRGTYIVYKAHQKTPEWFRMRQGRLTASQFGRATGSLTKDYTNENESAEYNAATYGISMEDEARLWYERTRNVYIRELGLAVPKWESRIGASIDGEILNTNGIIEIKCPLRMYQPIREYMKLSDTEKQLIHPRTILWGSHYDQIQGCLRILEKQYCDYIVYCKNENSVFVLRVEADPQYWSQILYPAILRYFHEKGCNT